MSAGHRSPTPESSAHPRTADPGSSVDVSVVVFASEAHDDLRDLYRQHATVLDLHGFSHEFIFVLSGASRDAIEAVKELRTAFPAVTLITLAGPFGEAAALSVAFRAAKGSIIVTLPDHIQIDCSELPGMIELLLREGCDVVVAHRHPRRDSALNRMQSTIFHWLTRLLTGATYRDLGCGVRVLRRQAADGINLYGGLHRFFPLVAHLAGFRVVETPVRQSESDAGRRRYGPGVYLKRVLDILTLFFLFRFTKTPLHFFGSLGLTTIAAGAVITGYLGVYRLLHFGPIADRPLLILGIFLIALGAQLFSIGLLGELIIFTHARDDKDYRLQDLPE